MYLNEGVDISERHRLKKEENVTLGENNVKVESLSLGTKTDCRSMCRRSKISICSKKKKKGT